MIPLFAQAAAPSIFNVLKRQLGGAFWAYTDLMVPLLCMGVAALIVAGFWVVYGVSKAGSSARIGLRAQQLRKSKDHREGPGGNKLREAIRRAIDENFGEFAFQAPVQVELFPMHLAVLSPKTHAEKRRRLAVEALDALEKASGDVVLWGKRSWMGGADIRIASAPLFGRQPDMHAIQFRWRSNESFDGLAQAIAYACARRARPVLNRPQDYKPEKL